MTNRLAIVTTTPARAYTIRHPDGRLVAEVLWGDFGRPVLSRYYEDRAVHTPERFASWHKACDVAQAWARDEWGLDVGEPEPEPVPLITVPGLPVDKEAETSIEQMMLRARTWTSSGAEFGTPTYEDGYREATRRIVAWLRSPKRGPGMILSMYADAIERGAFEEDGNG